jgi:NitT/TauT family transport system permease protein
MSGPVGTALPKPRLRRRGGRARWFLLSYLGLIVVWQTAVVSGVSRFLLPPPIEVGRSLIEYRDAIVDASSVTLSEVLLGFALASAGGLLLAIAITYSPTLEALFYPPILTLHAIPKLGIAPLLLIWFGFGLGMKVVVSFLIAFFPVVIETTAGLRSVDPALRDIARSLGASSWEIFWRVDLPAARPSIFSGLKVAVTLAMTGALVGEFISADRGLGFLLRSAVNEHLVALSFGVVFVVTSLSMALFGLVALVERLSIPWARSSLGDV